MKQRAVGERRQPKARPAAESAEGNRRRLWQLLGALAVVGLAFFLTQGWRARLLQDSARYRAIVAQSEATKQAEQEDAQQISALEAQVTNQPENTELRLNLAQRRWRQEGPAAAAVTLEMAPRPFNDPSIPRMLAHCYRLARREDRALETLNEGIAQFPKDGDLRADRAELFVLLAWHLDAEKELRAAESLGSIDAPLARASLARAKGDVRAARKALHTELEKHPDEGEAKRQLAAVAQNAGEIDEAVRLLHSLDPKELTAEDRVTLAVLYLYPKDPTKAQQALDMLDGVLSTRPDYARARFIRARGLRQMGRQAEARGELERPCKEYPRMFGPAYELGEIYRKDGRTAEAGKLFRQHWSAQQKRTELRRAATALMRQPTDAGVHLTVGKQFMERGLYGRAIVELERSLELKPGSTEAATLLKKAQNDINSVSEFDE